jgi:cytochrome P450
MALIAPPLDVPYDINGLRTFIEYRDITEILRSHEFGYGFPEVAGLRRTLGWIDGAEHRERRRLEVPLFSNSALRLYEREILGPQIDMFFDDCRIAARPDGTFRADLTELAELWMAQISARISGLDGVDTLHGAERFLNLTERKRDPYFLKADHETKARYAVDADEAGKRLREEFYDASVARRTALVDRCNRGHLAREDLPKDLLTLLLTHWNPDWDDDLAFREVMLFLSGAIGTTVRSLVHLIDHLESWFGAHPDQRRRATELEFLRRAANESLRLHPAIPAMMRRALADVTLSNGTVVQKGERVALLYGHANRDPMVFGEHPDVFEPFRRPLVEGVPGYGLTFAFGPHVCIGRNMAIGGGDVDADAGAPTGTLLTMALRLYQAGIQPDPDGRAAYDWNTMWDRYSSYPIVLTAL